ncbi:hypothetical protein ACHAXT_003218 [Thalassiosira profunda]
MSSPATPYAAGAPMLTPAELQKFEAPLIALAQLAGGDLRKLFYAFFSFLNRRTDFYCLLPDDDGSAGGRMGFKQGQAEQILLASFRQFPLRKVGPRQGAAAAKAAPPAAKAQAAGTKNAPTKQLPETVEKAVASSTDGSKQTATDGSGKANIEKGDGACDAAKTVAKEKSPETVRYTEEGKQIPVGNGGSTTRYVWTQTLEEVTMHVPLPEGLRAKDLDVKIGANSLSIKQKGGGTDSIAPIEGTLFAKVRPSESTWTLESTAHGSQKVTTLQLIFDKMQKTWWSIVLSGDGPLVDTKMVDSTRHISTYDDETQAQIRRIMFDQSQERKGLPRSQPPMPDDPPPMPNGQGGGPPNLPSGVEYIDGETLDKATISSKK